MDTIVNDKEKAKVLVVDDEEPIRTQIKWALSEDYQILLAEDTDAALKILKDEKPPVMLLDLGLSSYSPGGEEGMDLLQITNKVNPQTKIIIITSNESKETALRAIKMGAHDYYNKPINVDELKVIIKRTLHVQMLEQENLELQRKLEGESKFEDIVGNCNQMQEVFALLKRVAPTNATLLIYGESGTGKELIARAVHFQSQRAKKPFTTINCGAIPDTLLESELFGYEKGSFTGAYATRKGKLEVADGGTIFLDEIGELPPLLQVKLLRFLQEREVERIGSRQTLKLDVRALAATNKDLKREVERGNFREDLYYRLGEITVTLPPLRERRDDVILLANFFLNKFSQEYNKALRGFSTDAIRVIQEYKWPGNVRELENKIKRAIIMAQDKLILPQDLDIGGDFKQILTLQEVRERAEKDLVIHALRRNKGNITQAAKEIGVSRPTFHDLLKRHGIEADDYK
jgi:two-component system NtrC family response regulator